MGFGETDGDLVGCLKMPLRSLRFEGCSDEENGSLLCELSPVVLGERRLDSVAVVLRNLGRTLANRCCLCSPVVLGDPWWDTAAVVLLG